MDELRTEILNELKIELEIDEDSDLAILTIKLKNAMREIENAFNFKSYHTSEFKLAEMKKHIGNIKELTMYDFAQVGVEGEITHSEKNIKREYKSRDKCFIGIVRYAD